MQQTTDKPLSSSPLSPLAKKKKVQTKLIVYSTCFSCLDSEQKVLSYFLFFQHLFQLFGLNGNSNSINYKLSNTYHVFFFLFFCFNFFIIFSALVWTLECYIVNLVPLNSLNNLLA